MMKYKIIQEDANAKTLIEKILTKRGITLDDVPKFLNPTEEYTYDCELIAGIREGAELLLSHLKKNSNIQLQVDSDLDGYFSSAILISYLKKAGFKNNVKYILHADKEHGIAMDKVKSNTNLLIAIDASSEEFKKHRELKSRGIDILIIDHHEALKISPVATVINNQLCDYPNKQLSATGMVYKFCKMLDRILGIDLADYFLDIVAFGSICDQQDHREIETFYYTQKGLQNLNNDFIKSIIAYSQETEITPYAVSYYINPFINALIRFGKKEDKEDLFNAIIQGGMRIKDTRKGKNGQLETLSAKVCRRTEEVRVSQNIKKERIAGIIDEDIMDNNLDVNKILIVTVDEKTHEKALTGLLANELSNKYKKPTLLLKESKDNKTLSGSGRNSNIGGVDKLKDFVNGSKVVNFAKGHQSAFGISVKKEKLDELVTYANNNLIDIDKSFPVDFIFTPDNMINYSFMEDINNYKHIWSKGIIEPFLIIKDVLITKENATLVETRTGALLKINLGDVEVIKFGISKSEYRNMLDKKIELIGKCCVRQSKDDSNGQFQFIFKEYVVA